MKKKKLSPPSKVQLDARYRLLNAGEVILPHDTIVSPLGVCKAGQEHKVRLLSGYKYNPNIMLPIYRKRGSV